MKHLIKLNNLEEEISLANVGEIEFEVSDTNDFDFSLYHQNILIFNRDSARLHNIQSKKLLSELKFDEEMELIY